MRPWRVGIARWVTIGTLTLAAVASSGGALLDRELSHWRDDLEAARVDAMARLAPGLRASQAADGLTAAALRLLWTDDDGERLRARATFNRHAQAIRGDLRQPGGDGDTPASGASAPDALDALDALGETVNAADELAARRIAALVGLPDARERLVRRIVDLGVMIEERHETLSALRIVHPDSVRELRTLRDWEIHSKRLLEAALLAVDADADGGGRVSTAAAVIPHLEHLKAIVASLPESEFKDNVTPAQDAIDMVVRGEDGITSRLDRLRQIAAETETLAVTLTRRARELSASLAGRLDLVREDTDAILTAVMAGGERARSHLLTFGGMMALVTLVVVAMTQFRLVWPLRRLRRAVGAMAADGSGRGSARFEDVGGGEIGEIAASLGRIDAEARQRETALAEASARFELAIAASGAAMWDEDMVSGRAWWSPEYHRLLGYEPGEIKPVIGLWETLVHPDDRARAANAAERYLAGATDAYTATYRMRRKDGAWIWVEDTGRIQRGADGRASRFVGLMVDVTRRLATDERRREALAIAEAEARHREAEVALWRERRLGDLDRARETVEAELNASRPLDAGSGQRLMELRRVIEVLRDDLRAQ